MQPLLSRIRNAFAIQLSHLAVFRILLGLIVGWDLWGRFQLRHIIFGDPQATNSILQQGLMPTQLSAEAWTPWNWSLFWLDRACQGILQVVDAGDKSPSTILNDWHTILSGPDFASGILIAGMVVALLFTFGLFTRLSNFLLWCIVLSVQIRMPLLTTGADTLAKVMLFWSMWLPLGAVWSADAKFFSRHGFWRKRIHQTLAQLQANQPKLKDYQLSISTFATAAIMIQLVLMYFFTGLAKWNPQWLSGNAISDAMQCGFFVRPVGDWLGQQHWLTMPATYLVLLIELLCPILVFTPGLFRWTRRPTAWFLIGMHLMIATTMAIGTFSAISIASWILFFGSLKAAPISRQLWFDQRDKGLRPTRILVDSPRALATCRDFCIAALGVMVIWWNVSVSSIPVVSNSFPDWLKPPIYQLGLNQDFPMFANPKSEHLKWAHQLPDGQDIRSALPAPANLADRPASGPASQAEFLWRQLHVNLLYCTNESFKQHVSQRLIQWERARWQQANPNKDADQSQLFRIGSENQTLPPW